MCKCVHHWEPSPDDPVVLRPVFCSEVISKLLEQSSSDSFSWDDATKRLIDLKERINGTS